MAGVVARKLNQLNQNTKNAIVTALVVTKTEPKYFLIKKTSEYRGIITFTLRDSKTSLCNCKYWGGKESVAEYSRDIKIGDIIDVVCPMVVFNKFCSDENSRFLPTSTLPIVLNLNEGIGSFRRNDYQNCDMLTQLQELMYIPHRPLCETLRLGDLRYIYVAAIAEKNESLPCTTTSWNGGGGGGSTMPKQHVDVVVIVGLLRQVKDIQRDGGDESRCLDVVVFDQSIPDGMILSIWQNEWIDRALQQWRPMQTVLHLIDVDIVESNYHKNLILRKSARTVIYENPIGREITLLRQFIGEMNPRDFYKIGQVLCGETVPNPDNIRTQMTVQQIYKRLEDNTKTNEEEFTAVLYAMVTQFNIDGPISIVGKKCKLCQRAINAREVMCSSVPCQFAFSLNRTGSFVDHFYKINVNFGDHTGSLIDVRLNDTIAENIVGSRPEDFEEEFRGKNDMLEELKWRYLFKRFELKLVIRKSTEMRRQPFILVVSMQSADDLTFISSNIMLG